MRTSCSAPVAQCAACRGRTFEEGARYNAHRWAFSQHGERVGEIEMVMRSTATLSGRLGGADRKEIPMPGKRVQFDEETWNALDLLARDRMQDFQELADEAFSDLLRKHGRPTDLKTALRQSVGTPEKNAVINPDIAKRGAAPSVPHGPRYRVAARTGNTPKE
jgi:hypothetical protein